VAIFRSKVDGLRRRLRPQDIPAAMRALLEEKQMALRAVRARRETARYAARYLRRLARAPPSMRM
jgi:hypothetical protein